MDNKIKDTFNPIQAINTLRDNVTDILEIGKKIQAKRIQYVLALAKLEDAEKEARRKVFDLIKAKEVSISMARDWIKLEVAESQKNHDIIKEELRDLEDQREIIIEVNNATKASFKIHELEARNLNLN